MAYQPPFSLTDSIVSLVAGIAQRVGRIDAYEQLNRSPQLRKNNRIKTIHSSLAIEHNSLSLEQVTAVVDGKRVIAPPKDLLEVQNAITVYDALDTFNPGSVEDLLRAHRMLMGGLVDEAGRFRSGNVGVFDGDRLIHAGTPANYVPEVIEDLFTWMRGAPTHPLILSCVFHYEFEFIHPFQDGNGRMGRLWQTLILSKWNQLFAWLPVETLVKERQDEYYQALASSDAQADSTDFIEFMLRMIVAALDDIPEVRDDGGLNDGINVGITNQAVEQEEHVLNLVRQSPSITIAQMSQVMGVSKRQMERIVAGLKEEGRLLRVGSKRNGRWEVH